MISRGMLWALVATLLLTVASIGVRKWRESRAVDEIVASAPSSDTSVGTPRVTAAPIQQAPVTLPAPPAAPAAPLLTPGLRPRVPAATVNAMSTHTPPAPSAPPPSAEPTVATPPSPPPLPPPNFRLIGRYVDNGEAVAFFAQGPTVIAARVGASLPDGFVLKAVHAKGVALRRVANKESIEMNLETP